jgi:predicted ATPase
MARSRLEAVGSTGLTPLVGREQEVALLLERWAQVKDGLGQVVLLSGEAGIGKSRLVQVLKEHVATEPQAWLTPCQCSPYHQHTALYPMIDLLERVALRFAREESPQQKLSKLEGFLVQYGRLSLVEAVPLFASLLSLPLTADYAPLTLSPGQQKQKTMHALLTILLRIAAQQPVLFVMEDLHWVDPSTLELLSLLVDQGPTARILALLTFRPDFSPPWMGRPHLTQVTLNRLPQRQAAEMTSQVVHGKTLPTEVVEQVVAKTDGVPLFVEELTKMVLESGLLQECEEHYELSRPLPPLAIPATLHDSLMARLDRLATVKALAQLGATLGREFSYELLQAVSPWDEGTLQRGLHQLVAAEFLYQQGLPPQATYRFKHALIQNAAYQSLLRSTRQRYHQHIAQVVEARFPEICETQPELLAQHYTEAGLSAQALPYWQRAGERAVQRSANLEAISHLTTGLELLHTLPHSPERDRQELALQTPLGMAAQTLKGYAAPEVEQAYARARTLCQQVGDTAQLVSVLRGQWIFYSVRADYRTALALGQQMLALAEDDGNPDHLVEAHLALGIIAIYRGDFSASRRHLEQGIALHDAHGQPLQTFHYTGHSRAWCLSYVARTLWLLGYPGQALQRSQEGVTLAQRLAIPMTLAQAQGMHALLYQVRRDIALTQEWSEKTVAYAAEYGFPYWLTLGSMYKGWALAQQGQLAGGTAQFLQGLEAYRATGAKLGLSWFLAVLAELYGKSGQLAEGLCAMAEARAHINATEEVYYEAEVYRLTGELLLMQGGPEAAAAEAHFLQALEVARRQRAKSWELRAATSLSRLWQQQGKQAEARVLLAPVYGWFTEGFDTADVQEAKALLEALGA